MHCPYNRLQDNSPTNQLAVSQSRTGYRVTTGPGKSWKVVGFRQTSFQAWKVMENSKGPGKSWKVAENKSNVVHFFNYGIYRDAARPTLT